MSVLVIVCITRDVDGSGGVMEFCIQLYYINTYRMFPEVGTGQCMAIQRYK